MISFKNEDFFIDCKSTLTKTSFNQEANKAMINSSIEVIDFDKAKCKYIQGKDVGITPTSNDALWIKEDELVFVEFKDGNMRSEIYKVKRKNFESLLIFLDIIEETISFSRASITYILVYNEENSKKYIDKIIKERMLKEQELQKDEVLESSAFDSIANVLGDLSKHNMDIFGLRQQFKNMYFKEVYTFTKSEFKKYILENAT